jgi:hypothetical protein
MVDGLYPNLEEVQGLMSAVHPCGDAHNATSDPPPRSRRRGRATDETGVCARGASSNAASRNSPVAWKLTCQIHPSEHRCPVPASRGRCGRWRPAGMWRLGQSSQLGLKSNPSYLCCASRASAGHARSRFPHTRQRGCPSWPQTLDQASCGQGLKLIVQRKKENIFTFTGTR